MKLCMKIFGTRGFDAVSTELKQLHLRNTFETQETSTQIKEEYYEVLESHLFLKQEIEQRKIIKGRIVYGCNKHHVTIMKEDDTSPTVSLEFMLLTSMIDKEEGSYVGIIDIPNAFIQTSI